MTFVPFDASIPHVAYACLGGFVVLFGMFSLFIREKLYIGEACWAFLFGVIIGPYGANIFNPRGWGGSSEDVTNTITLEFSRVVLAIGVFAIGVELPKAYMARHWKSLMFLLVPVMTWGWFVSAGLIYGLIPGLNFLSSLAVAACLTPTDPILAAAVVGGRYADKHVPAHLRHLLAAESGCNDGAAFPFLYLALYLIVDKPNTGHAIRDWFLLLWLYQVVLGTVVGSLIGFGFRHLMKFCERKDLIDRQSYVAQYLSLALLTIGVCTMLGSDDLLAAFSCGTAFAWDGFFNRQTEESVFSSVIDLLFNVAAFVFVGAWMPFSDFQDPELTLTVWRLIVIAILVLLLRRLPIMIALYRWIPDVKTFREAVFSGHFGPIGIGAVFISTLAAEKLQKAEDPPANQEQMLHATIQPIVAFMVLCSITIHGLSIPFFSLGRRVHSVSRTWSRHEPAADWTNQARHIERGQDIVINRDSDMERGDLTPDEKLALASQQASDSSGSSPRQTDLTRVEEEDGHSHVEKVAEDAVPESQKEENPPDGTNTVQEWKEGPHRIVERRAGPGEEVEVEVVRNAYAPEGEELSSTFRGKQEAVHKSLSEHLHQLTHAPHELGHDVKKAEETVHHDVKDIEEKAKHVIAPQPSHEEDEEGWASDNGESSSAPRTRSKSPKTKPPSLKATRPAPPVPRRSRRRYSIRRGVLGHGRHPSTATQDFAIDDALSDEEDDARGPEAEPQASRSASVSSARNPRLGLLRSRETSPTRSVRFADEGRPGSGTNTPRISLFRSDSLGTETDEGPESPRNRVTFELPRSPR
ncbi:hypothetical protein PLICRDRAFT_43355 [Plicaturopsis crispa FD-325 SS-3]|nr:hypothetical protein PLICRDRAFT_43355 [Plicaturopsis crispa FD-325 SS-3]